MAVTRFAATNPVIDHGKLYLGLPELREALRRSAVAILEEQLLGQGNYAVSDPQDFIENWLYNKIAWLRWERQQARKFEGRVNQKLWKQMKKEGWTRYKKIFIDPSGEHAFSSLPKATDFYTDFCTND